MSLLGDYGSLYGGPNSGSTPSDDEDLRGNGSNPYSAGSPGVDLQGASTYPVLPGIAGTSGQVPSVYNYYSNPAPSGDNPFSAGAGNSRTNEQELSNAVTQGQQNAYASQLDSQQPTATPESGSAAAIWNDEGYGPEGTGRS